MVVVTELVGGCHTQSWVVGRDQAQHCIRGGGKAQHCTDGGKAQLNIILTDGCGGGVLSVPTPGSELKGQPGEIICLSH